MGKTIEIASNVIEFNNYSIDKFENFNKYLTNKSPNYIVNHEIVKDILIPSGKSINTEYYDLYENGKIQIQRDNNDVIGRIEYNDDVITIKTLKRDYQIEYLLTQYIIVYIINKCKNMLFMHGSSIIYKNIGIIFTAKSGVGKSTHTKKWVNLGNATILNDDKQIISYENDKLYLNPNPWSGKHLLDNNIKTELRFIVFIERDINNYVKKANIKEAFIKLLPQILNPDKNNLDSWNFIVDKILELNFFTLKCNMDDEAFYVIKKEIEGVLNETNK